MNKKIIIKWVVFLSLVAFFVYLIYIVVFKDINKQKNFLNSQIEILEKEKQVLEDENETLQEGIMLAFQEEYLEQEARINLGYKKEGENTVILKVTPTTTKSEEQIKLERSFWYRVKNWWVNL